MKRYVYPFIAALVALALAPTTAHADGSTDEHRFIVAVRDYLKKFVMLYTDTFSNVVMRTADKPEGPWSLATTIVSTTAVPGGIYAPYIHPWSSGRDLYFTLSLWSNYSVMLMRTTLG